MREYLFRGKSIDNSGWAYGNLIKRLNYDELSVKYYAIQEITSASCHNFARVIPETIGQYTGLCDKNGNRIFEGDIVRFSDKDWTESGIATVDFESGKWKINGRYTTKISAIVWLDLYRMGFEYEVIGNKWDNPELLEVER